MPTKIRYIYYKEILKSERTQKLYKQKAHMHVKLTINILNTST